MNELIIDDIDTDELDLVKLVSTNANDLNQYLLFRGSNDDLFALNVSKVEEVIVFDKNIKIVRNNDTENLIEGTADIRDIMTTVVYFDDWFGNSHLRDDEYELVILTNYGHQRVALIVKEVLNIATIEAQEMTPNSCNNSKTTFISKILIEEEEICVVFDGDKMLLDIFADSGYGSVQNGVTYTSFQNRVIYFADDSKLIRNLVEELLTNLQVQYKIFSDGQDLLEELQSNPDVKIDIIITDLEMPNVGGREVIKAIKASNNYENTSIFVHTNMANNSMSEELLQLGANTILGKIDMDMLKNIIIKEFNQ